MKTNIAVKPLVWGPPDRKETVQNIRKVTVRLQTLTGTQKEQEGEAVSKKTIVATLSPSSAKTRDGKTKMLYRSRSES